MENQGIGGASSNLNTEIQNELAIKLNLDRIVFLCGNGCSIANGTKSTADFSPSLLSNIGENLLVTAELKSLCTSKQSVAIENFLNRLLTFADFYHEIGNYPAEKNTLVLFEQYKTLFLNSYVNTLDYSNLESHQKLLRKIRNLGFIEKTSIYSLNYDLAFEYTANEMGLEFVDGFKGFITRKFDPAMLSNVHSFKIIKLHGSLTWRKADALSYKEIQPFFGPDGKISMPDNEEAIIYPTNQKYEYSLNAPYNELFRSLTNELLANRCLVLVLGYSFGDDHINNLILKSMSNPGNVYFFFSYEQNVTFIQKMKQIKSEMKNLNIYEGHDVASFANVAENIFPSMAAETDLETLGKVLRKVIK